MSSHSFPRFNSIGGMVHFFFIFNHFSFFLYHVETRKNFAMKVLFVPFKNVDSRKNARTHKQTHTPKHKIWWCWKKKKGENSFIHDLCKWSIFFDSWFKMFFFLGIQKITLKEKERKIELWLLFIWTTTCVDMVEEVE